MDAGVAFKAFKNFLLLDQNLIADANRKNNRFAQVPGREQFPLHYSSFVAPGASMPLWAPLLVYKLAFQE
jgi:hypothetical protein